MNIYTLFFSFPMRGLPKSESFFATFSNEVSVHLTFYAIDSNSKVLQSISVRECQSLYLTHE
jgi:hypothetical protein